jgi:hypothetical protein
VSSNVQHADQSIPQLHADCFLPANCRRLSAPALRTFLNIADLWRLHEREQIQILGNPLRSTFYNWAKQVRQHQDIVLEADTLIRISAVLGIHQGLSLLFANEVDAVAWLRRANAAPVFCSQSPIERIASGKQDDLMTVRRFIDAARGGHYMSAPDVDADFAPYEDSEIVFQ